MHLQGESAGNFESIGALVHSLSVLRHSLRGGVRSYEMGLGGDAHPELFISGLCSSHVGLHEHRRSLESVHA